MDEYMKKKWKKEGKRTINNEWKERKKNEIKRSKNEKLNPKNGYKTKSNKI